MDRLGSSEHSTLLTTDGPARPAGPLPNVRTRISRRRILDRLVRALVYLGGGAVVLSIFAILLVIVLEVTPLFQKASVASGGAPVAVPPGTLAIASDEYQEMAAIVAGDGVRYVSLTSGARAAPSPPLPLAGSLIVGSTRPSARGFVVGLSDGRILPLRLRFLTEFREGRRSVRPDLTVGDGFPSGAADGARLLAAAGSEDRSVVAVATGAAHVRIFVLTKTTPLIGEATVERAQSDVDLTPGDRVTALAVDDRGDDLYVGLASGEIARIDLRKAEHPRLAERRAASVRSISVLGFLLGDRTLVVGDAGGCVRTWQVLPADEGGWRLTRIAEFEGHASAVSAFCASHRDKGFVTADAMGSVMYRYGTTGRTPLTLSAPPRALAVALSPKNDGLMAATGDGRLEHWSLSVPHPEATRRSLFGKVWYEGYTQPEFVWQSSAGNDAAEPKFSLVPLIYGTLKGTLYALIFAVPLSLLAALYVSQFMHPRLRALVKPAVEIMAALPSVVLGFIAGLWLAPAIESVVAGVFLIPVVLPLVLVLAYALWKATPRRWREGMAPGMELFLLVPAVLLALAFTLRLGGWIQSAWMSGDVRGWLKTALGVRYDQRNSLVVGIAMGFAVIPIIFTIAEDSLSNVPRHLSAASLALGASRWHTALHVVLPTASPGIFSATMIGFGRAVGETMIVLMATGNTPVMDASIFDGFRALSANIAVELPEAPVGSTHYRVLFVAALLLFCMTFLVNTVAEVVRLRLRRRYSHL